MAVLRAMLQGYILGSLSRWDGLTATPRGLLVQSLSRGQEDDRMMTEAVELNKYLAKLSALWGLLYYGYISA